MFNNLKEATEHICETLKTIENTDIQPDEKIIHEILLEKILGKLTYEFNQENINLLEKNIKDDDFLESRIIKNIPNYQSLLKEISESLLSEYIKLDK